MSGEAQKKKTWQQWFSDKIFGEEPKDQIVCINKADGTQGVFDSISNAQSFLKGVAMGQIDKVVSDESDPTHKPGKSLAFGFDIRANKEHLFVALKQWINDAVTGLAASVKRYCDLLGRTLASEVGAEFTQQFLGGIGKAVGQVVGAVYRNRWNIVQGVALVGVAGALGFSAVQLAGVAIEAVSWTIPWVCEWIGVGVLGGLALKAALEAGEQLKPVLKPVGDALYASIENCLSVNVKMGEFVS